MKYHFKASTESPLIRRGSFDPTDVVWVYFCSQKALESPNRFEVWELNDEDRVLVMTRTWAGSCVPQKTARVP